MPRVRIDPRTGQEYLEPSPFEEVSQDFLTTPSGANPSMPRPLTPERVQIGAQEPLAALERARAEDALPAYPALRDMPPERPVADLESQRVERQPDYLKRMGGPSRLDTAGKGFWGTLGEFATSDMGKNLIGALGVGLTGLRNPRDQGQMQANLMAQVMQGAKERAATRAQGEAMGGLWEAITNANELIQKGDYAGAAQLLKSQAKNPGMLASPVAMGELLSMQSKLTGAIRRKGAFSEMGKTLTPESAWSAIQKDPSMLEDVSKLAPLLPAKEGPFNFFSAEHGIVGQMRGGQVTVHRLGTGMSKGPITMDTMNKLLPYLMRAGVADPVQFLRILNGRPETEAEMRMQMQAHALFGTAVLDHERDAREQTKTEDQTAVKAIDVEETMKKAGQAIPENVATAARRARALLERKGERAALAAGGAAAARREEGLNEPAVEWLKGGAAYELKSGKYRDVSRDYRNKGELIEAQKAGKVSILLDKEQATKVKSAQGMLTNVDDMRRLGKIVFTKETATGVAAKGVETWLRSKGGIGELGRAANRLEQYRGTAFDVAKALGGDSRISDKDAQFALDFLQIGTFFKSGSSFQEGMNLVEKVLRIGMQRAARDEVAPAGERLSQGYLQGQLEERLR